MEFGISSILAPESGWEECWGEEQAVWISRSQAWRKKNYFQTAVVLSGLYLLNDFPSHSDLTQDLRQHLAITDDGEAQW